ncbi:MipA/OmpV family protein [Dongia sedimenti]|uniref:MipA/OmpV family protein n=1 Tax=Dongia sedimenti TaxID=3064282 RepID=A0ABU0YRM9_9PROT|nr:MipA/OmpV family protein [Rhodospirillaceae bacterium R-7]
MFALGLLCAAAPLRAAHTDEPQPGASEPSWLDGAAAQAHEWNMIVGGGFRVEPKFEGADDVKIMPVPMIMADFGPYISVDVRGLTVNAFDYEGLSVKGRVGYDLGRDSDDDKHLHGLGDIGSGAVLGLDLAYDWEPVQFTVALDKTIGGGDGFTAKFGAAYSVGFDQFQFSIGPSFTWADGNAMESYFGVSDRQSRKSGLSRFDADAGIKRVDLELSGLYMLDEHWVVRGEVTFGYLTGDAADSPVSQRNFQPSTMFLVGYKF